ncbi:J domain-containing protein [Treponema sp.]|uniref:J domain-containing protein n=1 Tax=Treponema sp. TaxID=166 RepID=UPI003F065ECC
MKDYYKILGVPKTATIAEIRRAYRKKAKILHPDVTGKDSVAFQELAAAYEILSDIKSRGLFDEAAVFRQNPFHREKKTSVFDYRKWLQERSDDESRAKLIFFDLMHSNEDEAVNEFKRMNTEHPGFRLAHWFTREDFMDYGFILAEELVLRQEYYDAVILLDQIIQMEFSYAHFKLFFPEVKSLARHVLRNNIEGTVNDELAIDAWERALELQFGKNDDAFFLLKMGGAYERIGDFQTAEICRKEAARISAETE